MPSYHLGASSLVRASKRTVSPRVRTCKYQFGQRRGSGAHEKQRACPHTYIPGHIPGPIPAAAPCADRPRYGTQHSMANTLSSTQHPWAVCDAGADLSVGCGGVGDVSAGSLAIRAQALHHLNIHLQLHGAFHMLSPITQQSSQHRKLCPIHCQQPCMTLLCSMNPNPQPNPKP